MSSKVCHLETLANNGVAHVQRCTDCGGVTIHIGPVSLRLDTAGLEALSSVLDTAVRRHQLPAATSFSESAPVGQA
ncbi:MAG: hypothetical protein JNG84_02875 [Archangium sp.]|nr:hypothetical protein [Archangium sp.]